MFKRIRTAQIARLESLGDTRIADPEQSTFRFHCPPDCWGTCCGMKTGGASLRILLTPWDVYRLAQGLSKSMGQVLKEHCAISPEQALYPEVNLARPFEAKPCEFLVDGGKCGVRDFAPAICRGSPLWHTVMLTETGEFESQYWLHYPHPDCRGREPDAPVWNAGEWLRENAAAYPMDESHQVFRQLLVMQYGYEEWKSPETDAALLSLLYRPDHYAPAGLGGEELMKRSVYAALALVDALFRSPDRRAALPAAWSAAANVLHRGIDPPPLSQQAIRLSPPPAPRSGGPAGRNDPCPCGSGRKHKKCCGA